MHSFIHLGCSTAASGLHWGKAQLHLGKLSLSATLGEDPPANPHPAKASFPSVENRTLGEGFAECRAGTWERFDAIGRWPTPFSFLLLFSSLSATLGEDF